MNNETSKGSLQISDGAGGETCCDEGSSCSFMAMMAEASAIKSSEAFKNKMISIYLQHEIPNRRKLPMLPKDPPPDFLIGKRKRPSRVLPPGRCLFTYEELPMQDYERAVHPAACTPPDDFLIKRKRSRSR